MIKNRVKGLNLHNEIKCIAWVYPCDRNINYTLIHSLIRVLKEKRIKVEEFNTIDDNNIYNPLPVIEKVISRKNKFDAIIVLDLGYLNHPELHYSKIECPLILFAGDNPQSYRPNKTFIKNFLKTLFAQDNSGENLFGNYIGHKELSKNYDGVITSDLPTYYKYKERRIKSYWMPYWADTKFYYPGKENRNFDVGTVMTPRKNRKKLLEYLGNQNQFTFKNDLGKYNLEAANHYRNCKIGFNKSNYKELTIRIFEVMACGGLLITDRPNRNSGLYSIFKEDVDLIYFDNTKQLVHKVKHYLLSSSEREKIAQKGSSEVMKNHTEYNRAESLLEIILDLKQIK